MRKRKGELFIDINKLLKARVMLAINIAKNFGINNTLYFYPPDYPFDVEIQITAKEKNVERR